MGAIRETCAGAALALVCLTLWMALAPAAFAEFSLRPRPLDRAPEGLVIGDAAPDGYSHVLVLSWPKIAPEFVDQTPSIAAKLCETFGTVLLADVGRQADGLHVLRRAAIGHVVRGAGESDAGMKVVTPESTSLTFLAKRVLASGEAELGKVLEVARYDTGMVIDAPAVVAIGGQHTERTVRHFVWTNARRGGAATALWICDAADPQAPRLEGDSFVLLPAGFKEERLLSVMPSEFGLGMPSRTAFAMAALPKGKRVRFTAGLRAVAAAPTFTKETLAQLARELSLAAAGGD